MKTYFAVILKCIISCGLIWILLSEIDVLAAVDRVLEANPYILSITAVIFALQMLIGGARWGFVLTSIKAPLALLETTRLFYIGAFFSQVLPSSVGGDGIRMFLSYKYGLTLSQAINSVMIERVITLVGLAALTGVVLPNFISRLNLLNPNSIILVFTLLVFGLIAIVIFLAFLDRLPLQLHRFRIIRGMAYLAKDTRYIFSSPKLITIAILWGILTHVCISTYVFVLGYSLNLHLSWLNCVVLIPPVMLITTIPISIAGWGVRETVMVVALGLVGIPDEGALVLSILFGFSAIMWTLPAALIWALNRSKNEVASLREIKKTISGNNNK